MPAATNRLGLSFVKEVAFGTTPTTTQTNMRFLSESLKQDTGTTSSAEIQSDRQIPGVVRSTVGASGDTGFEYYLGGSLETLIATAAMQSPDSPVAGSDCTPATGTVGLTALTGRFTASVNFGPAPSVGEWLKIEGFSNAANNGYFRITAVVLSGSDVTTIAVDPNNATFVNEATVAVGGLTFTLASYYTNETTQNSFSIEKHWADLSSTFALYKGMTCDGMSLTVPTDGIITGGFTWSGKQATSETATADSGSHSTAGTGSVLSGIDNVVSFREGGYDLTITGFNFSLTNNLRQRTEVGSAFSTSVGSGSIGVSGSFQAYFAAGDPVSTMSRYLAGTDSGIEIVFTDGTNQTSIDLPRVRLTSGQRVAGGQNQDVIMEIGFEAFKHETLGHTMRYSKW